MEDLLTFSTEVIDPENPLDVQMMCRLTDGRITGCTVGGMGFTRADLVRMFGEAHVAATEDEAWRVQQ